MRKLEINAKQITVWEISSGEIFQTRIEAVEAEIVEWLKFQDFTSEEAKEFAALMVAHTREVHDLLLLIMKEKETLRAQKARRSISEQTTERKTDETEGRGDLKDLPGEKRSRSGSYNGR